MKMGSLFSGIGGLELGLERAIPGLQTVWQVEKEEFCRSVLERHWPNTKRYNNVLHVGAHNLEPVDIICAGFPCQSISIAGNMEGLENEEKSGLWWHVHRLVSEFQSIGRQPILVLENVANIIRVGGPDVVGSLAAIGYDIEWTTISAAQCGAPHLRRRWFAVAYPSTIGYYMRNAMAFGELVDGRWTTADTNKSRSRTSDTLQSGRSSTHVHDTEGSTSNTISTRTQVQTEGQQPSKQMSGSTSKAYWQGFPTQPPVCRRDDGVPDRVDRIKALGNAVVPQCAQWVGQQIVNSGLLEVACSQHN
jgi:DNA (cytosine-5)-methyltransferase 1